MGKFASLIGNSFGKQITDILTWYIVPALLGVVILWALWMGWRFIRTIGYEARKVAKKQFQNAFAILLIFGAIFCVIAGTNLALSPKSARADIDSGPTILNPTNPGNYGTPGGIADGDGSASGPGDGPLGTPWISEFTNPLEISNRYLSTQNMPDPGRLWVNDSYNYSSKRSGQNGYMPAERITSSWGWRPVFLKGEWGTTWERIPRGLACAHAVDDAANCVDHKYGENHYDMDIDTGEGEALVINIARQGFRPNPVPVHWLQPLLGPPRINPNPMVMEEISVGRSAAMRRAGTIPMGATSSWAPNIEVRAVADGTIVDFNMPEADNPYDHTWLVVKHDKPLPGQTESYSFYGGLYGSKKVTDLEMIRQYNTQPFMSGSATLPLPPFVTRYGAGGVFYTSSYAHPLHMMTAWSRGHWQQGPMGNLAVSPFMTAGLGIKRLIEPAGMRASPFVSQLWFPTSVLNKNFNWYPKGQYQAGRAADGGAIVGRKVKQGQFLAYAGGGLLDPGAGHLLRQQLAKEGDTEGYNLYTHRHLDFGMHYEWTGRAPGDVRNFSPRVPWPRLGSYNPRWWYDVVAYDEEQYEDKATWRWWKVAAENKHFENEQFFVPINYPGTPYDPPSQQPGVPPQPPPPGTPPVVVPPGQTTIPPGQYQGQQFPPTVPGPPVQPGFKFETPQNITSIGDYAFAGSNLGDALECGVLHLCEFTNLVSIGRNAFADSGIKGICFYESGKRMEKLETIGQGAFMNNGFDACRAGCHSQATNRTVDIINMPELEIIGSNALRNNNIERVNFNNVPNLSMLGDGAFRDNPITTLNFGNSSIESIMDNAFRNTKLPTLVLPSTVKTIGESAFRESNLAGITLRDSNISNIIEIGDYAFADNTNLTSIARQIFEDVFCGITDCIWECTDPECETGYATWARFECPHRCPTCSPALEWLGEGAFVQNTSAAARTYGVPTETHNGIVYLSPSATTPLWAIDIAASGLPSHIQFTVPVGKKVGGMADGLFSRLRGVNKVTLPTNSEFRNISHRAFKDCDDLVSVVIGDNIRAIGNDAFAGCTYVHLLDVPDSILYIGSAAFQGWNWPQMIIIGQTEYFTRERYAYEWQFQCEAVIVYAPSVNVNDALVWLIYHVGTTTDLVYTFREEYASFLNPSDLAALTVLSGPSSSPGVLDNLLTKVDKTYNDLRASLISDTLAFVQYKNHIAEYKIYVDAYNNIVLKIKSEMEKIGRRFVTHELMD